MGAGTITEIGAPLLNALKMHPPKQNVTILAGGASPEHAISLESAQFVMQEIDRDQYNTELIIIDRKGNFDGSEVYPNNLTNWDFDRAKAPGSDLLKSAPYYNMEHFSKVESRELSLRSKTNFSSCLGIN